MVVELGRRSLSSLSLSLSYYSHCFSLPPSLLCLSFFLRQSEKDNASASISEIVKIEIGGFCSKFLREEKRMLEADADNSKVINGGGFSQLQSCFGDCSSEEELTVLPRHTKVVVTGNNRTKSVLVGLQGVVKKAVGLGGWHWLVRNNQSPSFVVTVFCLISTLSSIWNQASNFMLDNATKSMVVWWCCWFETDQLS